MSLKCSIFGHRFGEPVVERDRDESGSEVVITIQESQTCDRCGHERVVSENKEVTTLETPAEPADDSAADDADDEASVDVPDAADDLAAVDSTGTETTSEPAGDAVDPATDDGTIIEESPEESIVEEAEPDEPAPAEATAPSGDDPAGEAAEDDAVILDDDSAESTTVEPADRDPGQWPEEPDDDGPEWEPPTDLVDEPTTATPEDTGPEVEPAGEAVTVPQGTFRCPECGFSTPVESSSLREGDFCPDCHTGTLAHQADEE